MWDIITGIGPGNFLAFVGGGLVVNCFIPEHCIDARRLPLFIARSALCDLITGLHADAEGEQAA